MFSVSICAVVRSNWLLFVFVGAARLSAGAYPAGHRSDAVLGAGLRPAAGHGHPRAALPHHQPQRTGWAAEHAQQGRRTVQTHERAAALSVLTAGLTVADEVAHAEHHAHVQLPVAAIGAQHATVGPRQQATADVAESASIAATVRPAAAAATVAAASAAEQHVLQEQQPAADEPAAALTAAAAADAAGRAAGGRVTAGVTAGTDVTPTAVPAAQDEHAGCIHGPAPTNAR